MARTAAQIDLRLTAEITNRAAADKALDAKLAALAARLAKLEAPVPPVPPIPPATTPPPAGVVRRVTTIAGLKTALVDNSVDEIVVANGRYLVPGAGAGWNNATALWMGKEVAARTRSIKVRAETDYGVIFDGGGKGYWNALQFQGAHDMTWEGFAFDNGVPTGTGVVVFGGYGADGNPASHHITMRRIRMLAGIKGKIPQDHYVYFSASAPGTGGPHDLLFEDVDIEGTTGGLMSAANFGKANGDNVHDVTLRRWNVRGTDTAVVVWEGNPRKVLLEDWSVKGAKRFAVRYENYGAEDFTFRRFVSSGSGEQGWLSSASNPQTKPPDGVVIDGSTFG